jgi:hypothetical protein
MPQPDLNPLPPANTQEPPEASSPEEPTPMLDVHPAHHAASTWRDFFIHIATIVIGLLIAIGLEQTVEYFHHRHLASEAREQLRSEREADEISNEVNIYTTERHQRDLRRDLAILHAVKAHAPLPAGPFIIRRIRYLYPEDSWLKIHQSGTINYISEDVRNIAYRYVIQDAFTTRANEGMEALYHASAVLRGENDPPQITFDNNLTDARFGKALVASHETLSEEAVQQGYASLVEHTDLTKLTPTDIDELERAIKIALVDDDALLTSCFNIKRNLQNNPVK